MKVVDFPNIDYDKGMAILKHLGYPDEEANLLSHQFAGDFEDDFGGEIKTAIKERFLYSLKKFNKGQKRDAQGRFAAIAGAVKALPGKVKAKWNKLSPDQKAQVVRTGIGIALTGASILASPGVSSGIGSAASGAARGVRAAAHGANRAAGAAMYRGTINRGHRKWSKQNRGGTLSDFLNTPAGKQIAIEAGSRYLIN